MDSIKLWIVSLCGALIITAISRIIVSGTRLEKSVNIFLSVFIFLYSVIPMNKISFKSELLVESNEYNKNDIYCDGYEQIVAESIKKICDEKNIEIQSIKIDSYINADGDYIVNSIYVESDFINDKKLFETFIKDELGFEVEVV